MFLTNYWKLTTWVIIISLLSLLPGQAYDPFQLPFWKKIYLDKIIHAGMYFVLTSLLIAKLKNKRIIKVLLMAGIAILYGGLMELLQGSGFVSRNSDWIDFIANSSGAIIALLIFHKISKLRLFAIITK